MSIVNWDKYLKTVLGLIREDACDYNGHLNDAQSLVLLTLATDTVMDEINLDQASRDRLCFSAFTVRNQLYYVSEARCGESVSAYSQILGWDKKRLRVFHRLICDEDQRVITELETLLIGVNMNTRKSASWPKDVVQAIEQLMANHIALPIPVNAGTAISKPVCRGIAEC